ncbi:hypothetical protein LVY75_21785 [Sinorhizobium sp. B11]
MPSEKSWNRLSVALTNLEYDLTHLETGSDKALAARDVALVTIRDFHERFKQQRSQSSGSFAIDFDAFDRIESDVSDFANSATMAVLAPLGSVRENGSIVLVRDAYEAVTRAATKRAAGYEAALHFETIRDLLEQLAADVSVIAKEISESTTAQAQPGVRRGANLLDNIALFLQEFEVDENDHRTKSFVESTVGRVRTIVMEANYPSIEQACTTIETSLTLLGGYVDQRIAALLTEDTDDIGDAVTSDASTASIDIGDQALPPEFVGAVSDVLEVVSGLETAVARIVNEHPEQQARGQNILDRLRMIRDPLSEALHQGSLDHAIAVLAVGWQSAVEIDASAVAQLGEAANVLAMDLRVVELVTKLGRLSNWPAKIDGYQSEALPSAQLRERLEELTGDQEPAPFHYQLTENALKVVELETGPQVGQAKFATAQKEYLVNQGARIAKVLEGANCSPTLKGVFADIAKVLGDERNILQLGQEFWTGQKVLAEEEETLMGPLLADLKAHLEAVDKYLSRFQDWRDFVKDGVGVRVSDEQEQALDTTTSIVAEGIAEIPIVDPEVPDTLNQSARWPTLHNEARGGRILAKARTFANLFSAVFKHPHQWATDDLKKRIGYTIVSLIGYTALTVFSHIPGLEWVPAAVNAARAFFGL